MALREDRIVYWTPHRIPAPFAGGAGPVSREPFGSVLCAARSIVIDRVPRRAAAVQLEAVPQVTSSYAMLPALPPADDPGAPSAPMPGDSISIRRTSHATNPNSIAARQIRTHLQMEAIRTHYRSEFKAHRTALKRRWTLVRATGARVQASNIRMHQDAAATLKALRVVKAQPPAAPGQPAVAAGAPLNDPNGSVAGDVMPSADAQFTT
jgi:hypothetical protein